MSLSESNDFASNSLQPPDEETKVLRARLRQRERQIEAIRSVSETLFSHDSIEAMLEETLTLAMETLDAGVGAVLLYEAERDALVFRCAFGPDAHQLLNQTIGTNQGIAGRVFCSGQPNLTPDASSEPDFNSELHHAIATRTRSIVTVPLKRRGAAPIGVMQALSFETAYDNYDLETLEIIASQAAIAIEDSEREQQTRKAAMVSFIGDLSHDIKNMLTPIQTGMWTLDPMLRQMFDELETAAKDLTPEQRLEIEKATHLTRGEYEWMLQNALDAADRVQNRTKEIADAVKGISSPPRFEAGDFNDACEEAVAALRLVAHDAQVELELELDSNLPMVQFDRKQIDTALYNLINNAIPETPEDGTILIRTRAFIPEPDKFTVEVADTGKGMPANVREKLFTDEAISTKIGGTGLGTRIVGDIVRRHHGTISVESVEGQGTTFTLILPMKQGG